MNFNKCSNFLYFEHLLMTYKKHKHTVEEQCLMILRSVISVMAHSARDKFVSAPFTSTFINPASLINGTPCKSKLVSFLQCSPNAMMPKFDKLSQSTC